LLVLEDADGDIEFDDYEEAEDSDEYVEGTKKRTWRGNFKP